MHTPKPWKSEYSFSRTRKVLNVYSLDALGLKDKKVCEVYGANQVEKEGNGGLIAAAPALLGALKLVATKLEAWSRSGDTSYITGLFNVVHAAIAAAEGTEPVELELDGE